MSTLLLSGIGYGKSFICKKFANDNNLEYRIVIFENIEVYCKSKFNQKCLFVLEDIDGLISERNCVQKIKKLIKVLGEQLMITCNSKYDPKLKPIIKMCKVQNIKTPTVHFIMNLMTPIQLDNKYKRSIIQVANGDIRFALLQAQLYNGFPTKKDMKCNVFEAVKQIFNRHLSLQEKSELFFFDYNLTGLLLQENYINALKYKKSEKTCKLLSEYSHQLSDVDLLEKRIQNEQDYSTLPIVADIYVGKLEPFSGLSFPKFTKYFQKKKKEKFDELIGFPGLT